MAFYMAIFSKLLIIGIVIAFIIFIANSRNNHSNQGNRSYRRLTRSQNDRYIAGVCGGIAEYFGWNASLVRVGFVLFGGFGMALPYVVLALILPVSRG